MDQSRFMSGHLVRHSKTDSPLVKVQIFWHKNRFYFLLRRLLPYIVSDLIDKFARFLSPICFLAALGNIKYTSTQSRLLMSGFESSVFHKLKNWRKLQTIVKSEQYQATQNNGFSLLTCLSLSLRLFLALRFLEDSLSFHARENGQKQAV